MPNEPLTAREWWLVEKTFRATVMALAEMIRAGVNADLLVDIMLDDVAGLRGATEKLLEQYADPA